MANPNEILSFYDTPRSAVKGISPIPIENMVIFQDDYETICLGAGGEFEMSIGEATVTDHDHYAPPFPVHPLLKKPKSLKERLANMLNSNDDHPFNGRAPLNVPSPSNKPWRPCLMRTPQKSTLPERNMDFQRGMDHNQNIKLKVNKEINHADNSAHTRNIAHKENISQYI